MLKPPIQFVILSWLHTEVCLEYTRKEDYKKKQTQTSLNHLGIANRILLKKNKQIRKTKLTSRLLANPGHLQLHSLNISQPCEK